jgi:hypothetical protein
VQFTLPIGYTFLGSAQNFFEGWQGIWEMYETTGRKELKFRIE